MAPASQSSVMDGSSIEHQNSQQDQNPPQIQQKRRRRRRGASSATSQLSSQAGKVFQQIGQELNDLLPMQKKSKRDMGQDEQQAIQQLPQRQDPIQLEGYNPQLQASMEQQRFLKQQNLHQQKQILQSTPQLQQEHTHMQQLQQHCLYPIPPSVGEHSYTSNTCARRLMQYLFHYRQRPPVSLQLLCAMFFLWKEFASVSVILLIMSQLAFLKCQHTHTSCMHSLNVTPFQLFLLSHTY